MDVLHVDCGSCRARGPACSDCVISVLLGPVSTEVDLDAEELGALNAMAESGLVPPLRLVRGVTVSHDFEEGFARSRVLP